MEENELLFSTRLIVHAYLDGLNLSGAEELMNPTLASFSPNCFLALPYVICYDFCLKTIISDAIQSISLRGLYIMVITLSINEISSIII